MTAPLTPARWQRIEALFELVADLPPAEQDAALVHACGDDAPIREEVRRLLARDRTRTPWIAALVADVSQMPAVTEPDRTGRLIGPYRVIREVGRGGQAVVFEAVRDDAEFRQRVAIKVPTRGAYSQEFLQRFRYERQILAQLQHPHIARLLDGGTTDEGLPFFALEFVEGVSINRHAVDRDLSIPDRLELFLQACAAVEYAHQNLVIHRDLKPGNILVTEGSVRLLDFGIAKLIDGADAPGAGHTLTGLAPVTPDYCSPEQLRGEPITTRTDVYSLGLVLFELLTGERAQQADTTSPVALERSICETSIALPSERALASRRPRIARLLRGDLDTIVVTAAHKDPARRYASVAALADDLRRHLAGEAIRARQDSPTYVAARFVRRHWRPIAAAVLLLVALSGGVVATAYQARLAERRFAQVRRIANTLLTDVHDAIRDLPTSTEAQELVLRTAVEYLDRLAVDAGSDRALQLEVARGYAQVGHLAYSLDRPSKGELDEARTYYGKARALIDPIAAVDPGDLQVAAVASTVFSMHAEFMAGNGAEAEALPLAERAVAIAEAAYARDPSDLPLLEALFDAARRLVATFETSPSAAQVVPRLLDYAERLATRQPNRANSLATVATAYAQAGKLAVTAERRDEAMRLFRRNIELQRQVNALAPENRTAHRNLMLAWSHLADLLLGPLGPGSYLGSGGPATDLDPDDRRGALEAATEMLAEAKWLQEHDPGDESVNFDYAMALGRQAPAFPPGDLRAIASLEEALRRLDQLAARNPRAVPRFVLEFRGSLAERHRQAGHLDDAIAQWRLVERLITDAAPEEYYPKRMGISIFENWAQAMAAAGDPGSARRIARRVLEFADAVGAETAQYARAPGWPPRAREWAASFFERLGDAGEAQRMRDESRRLWAAVRDRQDLPADVLAEARTALATPPAGTSTTR